MAGNNVFLLLHRDMHACMHACTSRNASCQRRTCTAAERRGRTIGNGVTSGNKMERNKKVPFLDGMYRELNFIFPWKTCRDLIREKKKKIEVQERRFIKVSSTSTTRGSRPNLSQSIAIYRNTRRSCLTYRACATNVYFRCVSSPGARDGERSGIGLEKEGEVKRNSLTDWRTRGGGRGRMEGVERGI